VKKADNCKNFATAGIINYRTHHNWLFRDKNKYLVTSNMTVYMTLLRVRELSAAPILQ
jgi:hypothetical protein